MGWEFSDDTWATTHPFHKISSCCLKAICEINTNCTPQHTLWKAGKTVRLFFCISGEEDQLNTPVFLAAVEGLICNILPLPAGTVLYYLQVFSQLHKCAKTSNSAHSDLDRPGLYRLRRRKLRYSDSENSVLTSSFDSFQIGICRKCVFAHESASTTFHTNVLHPRNMLFAFAHSTDRKHIVVVQFHLHQPTTSSNPYIARKTEDLDLCERGIAYFFEWISSQAVAPESS